MQGTRQIRHIIGANIRRERTMRKLTRRELAEQLGVDQGQIYQWETGRNRPSDGNLVLIADKFACDIAALYTERNGTAHADRHADRLTELSRGELDTQDDEGEAA